MQHGMVLSTKQRQNMSPGDYSGFGSVGRMSPYQGEDPGSILGL